MGISIGIDTYINTGAKQKPATFWKISLVCVLR